jgi:hypothetical protein
VTRRAGRLLAASLALATALAACAGGEEEARPRPRPADPLAPAASLRVRLDGLFREHVYLLASMGENALTRQRKPLDGASEAFDASALALAQELASRYGKRARDGFLRVWRAYEEAILGRAALAVAPRPRTARQQRQRAQQEQRIERQLAGAPAALGALAQSLTPVLSARGIAMRMEPVVAKMRAVVEAQAAKDYAKADGEMRAASDLVGAVAEAFAAGIALDLPGTFPGEPARAASTFRSGVTALLREHVYLVAMASENALTRQAPAEQAARAALDQSTAALAARVGTVYGGDVEKAFAPLWKRQGELLLAYAAAGTDQAKRDKAAKDLAQYATDLAGFLAGANARLRSNDLVGVVRARLDAIRAVIDAQVKGDFVAAGAALRTAAEGMDALGSTLAAATVAAFPSKFL